MDEQTEQFQKPSGKRRKGESQILGVSVRGLLVLIITCTVCAMAFKAMKVEEPLYSGFMIVLGFYFGQKVPSAAAIYSTPPTQ